MAKFKVAAVTATDTGYKEFENFDDAQTYATDAVNPDGAAMVAAIWEQKNQHWTLRQVRRSVSH